MHYFRITIQLHTINPVVFKISVIDLTITDLTSKATKMSGVQLPVKGGLSIVHQQLLRPFITAIIKIITITVIIISILITVLMMITITIFITIIDISPTLLIPTSSPWG